ncbi:MAG: NAD(P)/FAD-dependent oxidoreductase [Proteobacteria bacterium]|nr:NAD(P)/FAD-dependent oxidoreductase [Pseudomonadota bacterium]
MSSNRSIAIIGAGPVGALMSIFLARRGFEVTLFERRPDMRTVDLPAGRSINLALANRGINALDRLGLMDDVDELLIPMRGRMIHGLDGALQLQPYGNKPTEVIYSVSRAALNMILLKTAEAEGVIINFNQRCDHIDFKNKRLTVFDEGAQQEQSIGIERVIGADGGGSVVRTAIAGQRKGAVDEQRLGHGYQELTIPPGPDGAFQLEKNALHIWPRGGFMLIALPNIDGGFTATLFLPNEGPQSFAALRTEAQVAAFFDTHFADAVPLIENLTGGFFDNPIGMLGTIRCDRWHHGGDALIMGDAAHAIVPFHGQGMNAGFEDCVALDLCLDELGDDWHGVFAAFEKRQKPNANAIADMALENYVEMRDSVLDAKFRLKKEIAWKLEALYPDHFIPRYSMVMFHRLPYSEAYARGEIQAQILDELARTARTADDIDMELAKQLIEKRILPDSV